MRCYLDGIILVGEGVSLMIIRCLIYFLLCSYGYATVIHLSVLNKISAKKIPLVLRDKKIASVHDLVVHVQQERREKDPFIGNVDFVSVKILLDQGEEEPIVLYDGELSSSTRYPQMPLEHPLYDVMLDYIED